MFENFVGIKKILYLIGLLLFLGCMIALFCFGSSFIRATICIFYLLLLLILKIREKKEEKQHGMPLSTIKYLKRCFPEYLVEDFLKEFLTLSKRDKKYCLNKISLYDTFIIPKSNRIKLGNFIRKIREEMKMDCQELAEKAKIDKGEIQALEYAMISKLNYYNLEQIAEAMHTDYMILYRLSGIHEAKRYSAKILIKRNENLDKIIKKLFAKTELNYD